MLRGPMRPPWTSSLLLAAGFVALEACVLWWTFGSLDGIAQAIDQTPAALIDFLLIYRPAGSALLEHGVPVPGFFFTPFLALLFAPFAYVPQGIAVGAWLTVQIVSVCALAALGAQLLQPPRRLAAIWTPLAFPILHGVVWGQVSVPIVACLLGAVLAQRGGRSWLAAVLLGLTVSVKYYTGFVVLAFALAGHGKTALRTGVVCVLLLGVVPGVVLGGVEPLFRYYELVAKLVADSGAMLHDNPNSQHVGFVAGRLLGDATIPLARGAGLVVTVATLALLGFASRHRPAAGSEAHGAGAPPARAELAFVLGCLATPFWAPTCWPHYFSYLPACQLWLAARVLAPGPRTVRILAGAATAGSAFLVLIPSFFLLGGRAAYSRDGYAFFADALALLAAALLLLGRRSERAPSRVSSGR
jgi:hypothetical protein